VQAVIRLYREARRRKVFRTAALYVVGAWLALQVANVVFPGFGIPDAAIRALVWATVAGFPVALVFGWLFEVGPGGVRRTAPGGADGVTLQPLALRDYLLLAAFAAVALALIYKAYHEVRTTPTAAGTAVDAEAGVGDVAERLDNSIAVLPFANISSDPDNEYFCDGIAEEILDRLARAAGLTVIGRTSSFAFKGSDFGIDRISALLGVEYVLQGSVRKAGDQLRISAQLLDQGGQQVWSESFDRRLENIFEIQSEIAAAVATTVASQVVTEADTGHQPDLAAYDLYLEARTLLHQRDGHSALELLEKSVERDPGFAEAYAELAFAEIITLGRPDGATRARLSLDRALSLKPRLLRAQAIQGLWLMEQEPRDPAGAERVLRDVLAQDPNMGDALNWLTGALSLQGRDAEARAVLERAVRIDPLHPSLAVNLAQRLYAEGRGDEARRIVERQLAQPSPNPFVLHALAVMHGSAGRLVDELAVKKLAALKSFDGWTAFDLAGTYARLGDWPQAETWIERMHREDPELLKPVFDEVPLPAWQGRDEIAARRLLDALVRKHLTFAELGEEQRLIAGAYLARGGEYSAAIELLEPAVRAEHPSSAEGPNLELHGAHALAWAYEHTGAPDRAERLLAAMMRECDAARAAGSLEDSWSLHRCAQTEALRGNREPALALFEQSIEAGWRDYYLQHHDPYWASLEDEPRYRALMARVKADVDRQRAEVQQIESREDFAAKLDAAIAARRSAASPAVGGP
jgi:TolB-like protein